MYEYLFNHTDQNIFVVLLFVCLCFAALPVVVINYQGGLSFEKVLLNVCACLPAQFESLTQSHSQIANLEWRRRQRERERERGIEEKQPADIQTDRQTLILDSHYIDKKKKKKLFIDKLLLNSRWEQVGVERGEGPRCLWSVNQQVPILLALIFFFYFQKFTSIVYFKNLKTT